MKSKPHKSSSYSRPNITRTGRFAHYAWQTAQRGMLDQFPPRVPVPPDLNLSVQQLEEVDVKAADVWIDTVFLESSFRKETHGRPQSNP